jgi:adenylate cyclase
VIHSYNGTVDKYMGDAVMAFWGAPVEDERHADHAVSCALAMVQEAEALSQEFRAQGLPDLGIGIGINTGRVLVGEMGSHIRRTYTAIGDAVNLASRLEQLTKQFDARVIVGETTMLAASGHTFKELGSVLVSGRMESAVIFEPARMKELDLGLQDLSKEPFNSALDHMPLELPKSMRVKT